MLSPGLVDELMLAYRRSGDHWLPALTITANSFVSVWDDVSDTWRSYP